MTNTVAEARVDEYVGQHLLDAPDRIVAGRAADGDVAAFGILVKRYSPLMRAYVQRMLESNADVDDVVQEAFITAWQRLDTLRDPTQVKGWLMRIASRNAIDRIRARRNHDDVDAIPVPTSSTDDPAARAELRSEIDALRKALQTLPADQRACWMLREIDGHSYDEIAELLGVSASTVRGQLARARRSLLAQMEVWR